MKSAAAVFLVFLALYVATMGPALAPYRDTGEMAVAADTLGVAHPTSYPSYIMLGHLAQRAPLGNKAYRLALLSAAAAALACALIFASAASLWGRAAGVGAALLLGLNPTFWSVAQVQEMYSLGALAAIGLMALALRLRRGYSQRLWHGFVFLSAAALTNRLDLLLWAPGLLWLSLAQADETRSPLWAALALAGFPAAMALSGSNWPIVALIALTAWWRCPRADRWAWTWRAGCWALAGLAAYLYLPVRSLSGPWLDWNHPAVPAQFADSLLRTRYGGTLDLLSKSYAVGELFAENLRLYARHLWDSFWLPGLALAGWGSWRCAREDRRRWLGMAAAYWWSGPVFLFMANLPPNPHAAAIVEPHYLLSDIVLAFWAAEGLGALAAARAGASALAAAALLAAPILKGHFQRFDRRTHLYSYDFARSVLASAPPRAVVVAKKDVQLYALWSYQRLQGWRPDVRVIAQGLAGSSWYQQDWRRRDKSLALYPLNDAQGWRRLAASNGTVLATPDADLPGDLGAAVKTRGRLYEIDGTSTPSTWIWSLLPSRGGLEYSQAPDFFTSDLIGSRAQSLFRLGSQLLAIGRREEARDFLMRAWSAHWELSEAPLFLGYLSYSSGDLEAARAYYSAATGILDGLLELARRYRALPGVTANIRRSGAEALMHLGVVTEKLGDRERALTLYERSIERHPLAQAHYNLAVLWWNRDWARVKKELEETLRLDPGHHEAARYLARLKAGR